MDKNQIALGRFSEPALLMLSCLQSGPKEWQNLREEMERVHGLHLEPGTFWGVLCRLEYREWIEPLIHHGSGCCYRLTAKGSRVLHDASTLLQDRIVISDLETRQRPASSRTLTKMSSTLLGRGMLRFYPRPWRARYAAEMRLMLEQQTITFLTLLDLLRGAMDAQFHPQIDADYKSLARRRLAAISFIWIFPLFFVVLFVLAIQNTVNPFSPGGDRAMGMYISFATLNNSVVHISSNILLSSLVAILQALLASGLLLCGMHMRAALVTQRMWTLAFTSLSVLIELLALIGLITLIVLAFASLQDDGDGGGSTQLVLLIVGLIVLGAIISLVLAICEIFKKKMTRRVVQIALIPAAVGTFAMTAACIAYGVWGITTLNAVTQLFGVYFDLEGWQRTWEINLFLLALPTAFLLWR